MSEPITEFHSLVLDFLKNYNYGGTMPESDETIFSDEWYFIEDSLYIDWKILFKISFWQKILKIVLQHWVSQNFGILSWISQYVIFVVTV